ncbi:MAG: 30S ribosomal protein S6 [Candidatus Omnitrophota bacterium]|jgi:small subunit ribosomal protein S6
MKKYEGLFIFPPEDKDQALEVTKWIEKFQGKVLQKADLGKRTIGYQIRKFRDGKFLVFNFEMDPSKAQDFRKDLEQQETLLKYMVTVLREESRPSVSTATSQTTPQS